MAVVIHGQTADVGLGGDLLQDLLVVIAGHQLRHELVASLYYLVYLVDLFLFEFLMTLLAVLALFLMVAPQGAI